MTPQEKPTQPVQTQESKDVSIAPDLLSEDSDLMGLILKNHPGLMREKAEAMCEAFGF